MYNEHLLKHIVKTLGQEIIDRYTERFQKLEQLLGFRPTSFSEIEQEEYREGTPPRFESKPFILYHTWSAGRAHLSLWAVLTTHGHLSYDLELRHIGMPDPRIKFTYLKEVGDVFFQEVVRQFNVIKNEDISLW